MYMHEARVVSSLPNKSSHRVYILNRASSNQSDQDPKASINT